MDNSLTVCLVQTDIAWENPQANLDRIENVIRDMTAETDLIILPEMFSTGFSMNSRSLAQPADGPTVSALQAWAREYDTAFAGSFIAVDNGKYFNRGFFITPDDCFFYDKRHLFRMSPEPDFFDSGNKQLIVAYKGWNISLQICYDLRFPVWTRNVDNAYDLQIFVASWPKVRRNAWDTLLRARAIENSAFVAGVNRVGTDPNGIIYDGGSVMIDMKGQTIAQTEDGKEMLIRTTLLKSDLDRFRQRFPSWMDADRFTIENS